MFCRHVVAVPNGFFHVMYPNAFSAQTQACGAMAACLLFLYSASRSAVTRAQESLRLHGLVAVSDAHCLPSEAAEHASWADSWDARFPAQVCKQALLSGADAVCSVESFSSGDSVSRFHAKKKFL